MAPRRLLVAITGASGVIYGIRMLRHLKSAPVETHLILSEAGVRNIEIETPHSPEEVSALADRVHAPDNLCAPPASGSYAVDAMVVAPCTVKTLSAIVNSYTDNLVARAADVALKEKRPLVVMFRETPLHQGHLSMLTRAADLGAHILPPMPAFYHHPRTLEDIVDQTIGKAFDYLGIDHDLFRRWGGNAP